MSSTQQSALATTMLVSLRSFDNKAGTAQPTAAPIAALSSAVTSDCTAGTDCSNPDKFCDTDLVTHAAVAEYALLAEQLRP
jgi:hypothetical protein